MKKEPVKLSKASMKLVELESFANVKFAEGDTEKKNPQLEMLAYSGGIIKGHWYWGDLAIDMSGMTIPKKFPILEDHYTSQKIGFATKHDTHGNTKLTVTQGTFVDTPESLKFRELSGQGFPFQASIYAQPTQILRLGENETAEVNGYTMKGPGTIWKKCTLKEASVCTFGYDPNTSSAAMADKEADEEINIEYIGAEKFKEEEHMDITKLKAEHPKLVEQLSAEAIQAVTEKFSSEKAALEAKVAELTDLNTKLTNESKDTEKRLIALEKADQVRAEKFNEAEADRIFTEKFTEATLPSRIHDKVRRLLDHKKFICEDGKLDIEAFKAAVDTELGEWSSEDGSVIGLSTSTKATGEADKLSKACDEAADRMLKNL